MGQTTMSFALPDALRSYIELRVRSGQYGNTSEYLRELIRRDQEEQAKRRLRELIEEGLRSGPARALTPRVAAELKRQALGLGALRSNLSVRRRSPSRASTKAR